MEIFRWICSWSFRGSWRRKRLKKNLIQKLLCRKKIQCLNQVKSISKKCFILVVRVRIRVCLKANPSIISARPSLNLKSLLVKLPSRNKTRSLQIHFGTLLQCQSQALRWKRAVKGTFLLIFSEPAAYLSKIQTTSTTTSFRNRSRKAKQFQAIPQKSKMKLIFWTCDIWNLYINNSILYISLRAYPSTFIIWLHRFECFTVGMSVVG